MKKIKIAVLFVLSILLMQNLLAAEVQVFDTKPCQMSIVGDIVKGDSDKMLKLLKKGCKDEGKVSDLYIDSLGGSASESEQMVSYIKAYKLRTIVDKGDKALSAGFTLLMSGRKIFIMQGSYVGTHAVWFPKQDYNDIYLLDEDDEIKKPYYHLDLGIKSVTDIIEFDRDKLGLPGWLIVKYITKVDGDMYHLTYEDVIRLEAEGKITYVQKEE